MKKKNLLRRKKFLLKSKYDFFYVNTNIMRLAGVQKILKNKNNSNILNKINVVIIQIILIKMK